MKVGDQIPLQITSVAYGGEGIGRHEGRVVFVPLAAPGDQLEVEITKAQARHARGKIVSIQVPAATRVPAPCPYYGVCGGCTYQHVEYPLELEWKRQQVVELLQRVGRFEPAMAEALARPVVPSPEPYGYRNRITVHADGRGRVGFWHLEERGKLVDIRQCLLALPEVNKALLELRTSRPREGHYSLRASGIALSGFHQANQLLLEKFQRLVVEALTPDPQGTCVEGYAGGGFFTKELVSRFARVEMIESDARLVRDAKRELTQDVVIHEGRVEDYLSPRLSALSQENVSVLLDPPREGLAQPVIEALCRFPATQLVYVSCDPATWARDAARLSQHYNLEWVQPVDLFAHTAAIECVSRWTKK